MSAKEVANADALRRIVEAQDTGATFLDLSNLDSLAQLPRELEQLTSLQTLNLSGCGQLRELTLPAALSALQTLDLSGCHQLRELTLPTSLNALQTLNLSGCGQLRELTLPVGLKALQTLNLSGCGRLSELTLRPA